MSCNRPDRGGRGLTSLLQTHSYHSYVSMEEDTNAGLIGPTFIYHSGQMDSVITSHREIPFVFMIYDESRSFLADKNAQMLGQANSSSMGHNYTSPIYGGGNQSVWQPQLTNFMSAKGFGSASSYMSINGYIFANNPTFSMCEGDKTIWYAMAYGAASHVFHMHGSGFTYRGENNYAIALNDGVGKTLVQDATAVGKWQVICHVNNHQNKGMLGDYQIWPSASCPLQPLCSASSSTSSSSSSPSSTSSTGSATTTYASSTSSATSSAA